METELCECKLKKIKIQQRIIKNQNLKLKRLNQQPISTPIIDHNEVRINKEQKNLKNLKIFKESIELC
jgi:uncharacterized protein YlaI